MYVSKKITESSYPEIQKLYLLSFGPYYSLEFIKLKYDTQRFGSKNIGFFAYSKNNELAAYYGVFPLTLSYESKDYLIAQSGDTMTAPNHRKKGLFTRLAKEAYALSKSNGIKLVYGFPNENSYPGLKRKLDWEFHGLMQQFTFNVITIPFSPLATKFKRLRPISKSLVKNRIAKYIIERDKIDFDAFSYSLVKGHIKKDKNFFDYKLNRDNNYMIAIDGIQMIISVNTHLFIGEISKIEPNQAELLIKNVKKLARRLGCIKVIFTISKNHWLFDILKAHHTPTENWRIGFYLMNDSFNPKEIQFSNVDYDTF